MRNFADLDRILGQVPGPIVTMLGSVDVGRGSEALYRDQLPGVLNELANRARVASITMSSAIEGVVVDDQTRADRIVRGEQIRLRTRSEQEFAGYRDALDYLFQEDWRPASAGLLLHLHRLLFAHTVVSGGRFKTEDNLVVDRAADGTTTVRFRPVPANETDFFVHELIDRYRRSVDSGAYHPALLAGLFVLDFTVIHPFEDGNGRVARAVTNALLADAGYGVVRYVSLEKLIAQSADAYYRALLDSTKGWHEDGADPWPWLGYFVGILAEAYQIFTRKAAAERTPGSKQQRVREYVLRHAPMVFSVADVRAALPGVSDQTIRLVLTDLRERGEVNPDGVGRAAVWRKIPRA